VGIRGKQMIIKVIALTILIEALTELFFKAAPLQGIRRLLIKITPFLCSKEQGHLFECKYCTSIWVGVAVILMAAFADYYVTRMAAYVIIITRISNYVHIIYSIIRDAQINMQLKR
jgi:hypothetical protein